MRRAGLYIHIPFCHAKCGYCDFATFAGIENKIPAYLEALKIEISMLPVVAIDTLFVGGGTPTVLTPTQIDELFKILATTVDMSFLSEATVEANPESASDDVLKAYYRQGFNRLSFGLQTADNALLKEIDRLHSSEQFLSAFRRARGCGYDNINVDLIYGLPGQTLEGWKSTLEFVLHCQPEHISAYALKIEPGSKFAKTWVGVDDDLEADMYLMTTALLSQAGYVHYEISNFSKPGYQARHNLKYWRQDDVIGIGLSSASYIDGVRTANTKNMTDYLQGCNEHQIPIIEKSFLDEESKFKEKIMLALRLREGVDVNQINPLSLSVFEDFLHRRLAFIEKGMYCLTPQGWMLSNQIFKHLV